MKIVLATLTKDRAESGKGEEVYSADVGGNRLEFRIPDEGWPIEARLVLVIETANVVLDDAIIALRTEGGGSDARGQ